MRSQNCVSLSWDLVWTVEMHSHNDVRVLRIPGRTADGTTVSPPEVLNESSKRSRNSRQAERREREGKGEEIVMGEMGKAVCRTLKTHVVLPEGDPDCFLFFFFFFRFFLLLEGEVCSSCCDSPIFVVPCPLFRWLF
jgi:hypothetical protein